MYDNTLVLNKCKEAKSAVSVLASSSSFIRNKALEEIALSLEENCESILQENKKDIFDWSYYCACFNYWRAGPDVFFLLWFEKQCFCFLPD